MSSDVLPPNWEPFPVHMDKSQPPLFIYRQFTSTTYSVHLTDLIDIWSETLNSDQIIEKADDYNSPIKPETDPTQMSRLLSQLSSAVSGTKEGVIMEMEVRQGSGDGMANITLHTREPLQKPLGDLNWKFRLKYMTQRKMMTEELVLPMVSHLALQAKAIEGMEGLVREKDVVIERFVNMFHDQKMDLATLFPGYKGGRALTGKSKGLAVVDLDVWRNNLKEAHRDEVVEWSESAYPLGGGKAEAQFAKDHKLRIHLSMDEWWSRWQGKKKVEGEVLKFGGNKVTISPFVSPRSKMKEEDSFEKREDVDMVASSPTPVVKDNGDDDDDTTSDEDLDAPVSSAKATSSKLDKNTTPKKLKKLLTPEEDQTSSEDEAVPPTKSSQAKSSQTLSGGGPKDDDAMDVDEAPEAKLVVDSDSEEEIIKVAPPKKIVVKGLIKTTIGGQKRTIPETEAKRKNDDDTSDDEPPAASSPPTKELSPTPVKVETPLEAADRKRAELAKQMEAKRNAPKKKTRRF